MKKNLIISYFLLFLLIFGCTKIEEKATDYFNQAPPGLEAEIFAPGIISLPNRAEQAFNYAPDGKHCYVSVRKDDDSYSFYTIIEHTYSENGWSDAKKAGFLPESGNGLTPVFYPNSNKVYFPTKDSAGAKANILVSSYINKAWTEPVKCQEPINSSGSDWHLSFSNDSTMYLSSNRGGENSSIDIYVLENFDGKYPKIESLGDIVNTTASDCNPIVSPDGNYLIFESKRDGTLGGYDLYVSFKNQDGSWNKPINLGENINTKDHEMSASISPDSKYLFFVRRDLNKPPKHGDIYWVSIDAVTSLH
jgi:hypothetical protein